MSNLILQLENKITLVTFSLFIEIWVTASYLPSTFGYKRLMWNSMEMHTLLMWLAGVIDEWKA